jgi:hypothetical protein
VSGNTAAPGFTAGIRTDTSKVTLKNVTVSGNSATGSCTGIDAHGPVFMTNVTVTGNKADSDNTGGEHGGGICTVSGFVMQNSIVAGNTAGTGSVAPDCYGTVTSNGHNLIGNTQGCTIPSGGGNLLGVDAGLKPLQSNGGFTKTHALKANSNAIDKGSPKAPGSGGKACERRDQRGVKRPQGPRCDIGAYERK